MISYDDAKNARLAVDVDGNSAWTGTEVKGGGLQGAVSFSIPLVSGGGGGEVVWFGSDKVDRSKDGLYSNDSKLIPYIYLYAEADEGISFSKSGVKYLKDSLKDASSSSNVLLRNMKNQTSIRRPEVSGSGFLIVGNDNFKSPYDYLGSSDTFSITLPTSGGFGVKLSTSNNAGKCRTIGTGVSSNLIGISSGTSNYFMVNPKVVEEIFNGK